MWRTIFLVYVAVAIISQAQPLTAVSLNSSIENTQPAPAECYFREHTASNLLYTHIAFMLLSWIGALPICTRYLMRDKLLEC